MRKSKLLRLVLLGSVSLLSVSFLIWVIFVIDPFEWGSVYSNKFTWDKFNNIQAGEPIASVVRMLGQPISPPGLYRTNMPGGVLAECGESSQCELFKFSGTLFFGGREAIIIVNRNTGRVIAKWVNREP